MSRQVEESKPIKPLKILSETFPIRCEVCHQSDQYDALTNNCLRCSEINATESRSAPRADENQNYYFYSRTITRDISPRSYINRRFTLLASALVAALIYFSPGVYYVAKHGFSTNSISSEPAIEELSSPTLDYPELPVVQMPTRAVPYEVELSLNEPLENPSVVLAVNAVTVVDCDEPIVEVRTPDNDSIEVQQSSSLDKRLYLIGKYPVKSSNLILVSKNNVFNVYFEVRENPDAGNFNVLVKIKK